MECSGDTDLHIGRRIKMFGWFKYKKSFEDKAYLLAGYTFPKIIISRFNEMFPGEFEDAERGLKLFFLLVLWNEERHFYPTVEMYNKTADELWHIFLLDTKGYADFCDEIFGHFIHHIPYESVKPLDRYFDVARKVIDDIDRKLRLTRISYPYFKECIKVDGKFYVEPKQKITIIRNDSYKDPYARGVSESSQSRYTPDSTDNLASYIAGSSHSSCSTSSSSSSSSSHSSCSSSSCGGGS
jgi:hypothetical protein